MAALWFLVFLRDNVNTTNMYQSEPAAYVQATLHTYTPSKKFSDIPLSKILVKILVKFFHCHLQRQCRLGNYTEGR